MPEQNKFGNGHEQLNKDALNLGPKYPLQKEVSELLGFVSKELVSRQPERDEIIKKMEEKIDQLFENYDIAMVWDAFIQFSAPVDVLSDTSVPDKIRPASSMGVAQREHHNKVEIQERGSSDVISRTFGLYEPGYLELLKDDLEQFKTKSSLRTLLLGSQSKHSANEFLEFSKSLNEQAVVSVIDLGRFSLESAADQIKKIQGDATLLPIRNESQDIIFTNFLLPQLKHNNCQASGEKIVSLLQEAEMVLAPGGTICLMEGSPFYRQNYGSSWLTYCLLQRTLFWTGFSDVQGIYALCYNDHRDKKNKDQGRVIIETGEGDIVNNTGKMQFLVPFSFGIKARK